MYRFCMFYVGCNCLFSCIFDQHLFLVSGFSNSTNALKNKTSDVQSVTLEVLKRIDTSLNRFPRTGSCYHLLSFYQDGCLRIGMDLNFHVLLSTGEAYVAMMEFPVRHTFPTCLSLKSAGLDIDDEIRSF